MFLKISSKPCVMIFYDLWKNKYSLQQTTLNISQYFSFAIYFVYPLLQSFHIISLWERDKNWWREDLIVMKMYTQLLLSMQLHNIKL